MSKILITGGTGLVGSSLEFDNCVKLSSKDCDLRDAQQTYKLFESLKPDKVIHCAAKVGGVLSNMAYKGDYYHDNIMINTNVLEASRRVGVKRVLSFLSTCVFPKDIDYPLTEDKMHDGAPHEAHYPYAYAKRMLDIQSRAYREQYGCDFISVIPVNLYGPNDNFNLENSHVAPALIRKCYEAKINNTPFVVWGTGKPYREFIYIKDIAKLTAWTLENYQDKGPLIFTSSIETSINELVEIIAKCFSFDGKIVFDKSMPDGQYRKPSSNKKLLSHIPDFEFTSLEDGIAETCEWFQKKYETVRK